MQAIEIALALALLAMPMTTWGVIMVAKASVYKSLYKKDLPLNFNAIAVVLLYGGCLCYIAAVGFAVSHFLF